MDRLGLTAVSIAFLLACVSQNAESFTYSKKYRAMTGVSMGAFGALNYGLKHPEKFQVIGAMGGPVDMRGMFLFISRTLDSYVEWKSAYIDVPTLFNMMYDLSISFGNPLYEGNDLLLPEPGYRAHCPHNCDAQHALVPAIIDGWNIPSILAVDINDNERFDYGEPLVHQMYEPFTDMDDSGWRDDFEPYDDMGLDGVPNTNDYGEGNGFWDYDPDIDTFFEQDPYSLLERLSQSDLESMHIYLDAGLKDDFDFNEQNDNFALYLLDRDPSTQFVGYFSFFFPRFRSRHAYFRYWGDHIGMPNPLILKKRFINAFSFVSQKLPGGEYGFRFMDVFYPSTLERVSIASEALGRDEGVGIYLPPGYNRHKDKTYPVIYFLNGYGSRAENFISVWTKVLLDWFVYTGYIEKSIIVFMDGRSQSQIGGKSTFYVNQLHSEGELWEDFLDELIEHVDNTYRTK